MCCCCRCCLEQARLQFRRNYYNDFTKNFQEMKTEDSTFWWSLCTRYLLTWQVRVTKAIRVLWFVHVTFSEQ